MHCRLFNIEDDLIERILSIVSVIQIWFEVFGSRIGVFFSEDAIQAKPASLISSPTTL